ncbi:MAG: septum formation protein [Flavobacteriales bacterium]|jgi:septum formation protein
MLLENIKHKKIILASQSPRRKELIGGLGIPFETRLKDVPEIYSDTLHGEEIPMFLSQLKANAFKDEMAENEILITADTTVHLGDQVLGKPADLEEAVNMLRALSGKSHDVITGVTICTGDQCSTFSDTTEVTFAQLNEIEINHYVQTFKPLDKAGGYAVQELIGYIGITGMVGSYYNVVGLPIQKVYAFLSKL